ncbi:MAG: ABC-type transport auxiliary lipoprotein family protein [Burkholderiales bacterium]
MRNIFKYLFLFVFFASVCGCAIGPEKRDPPVVFDLGPQRNYVTAKPAINATLLIAPVSASPWLDSPNIMYRLTYRDAGRPEAYAQHRWAMSPALLLTERLRGRFAAAARGVVGTQDGARADYSLRIELEDFSQSFDAAESSKTSVRLRASLIDVNTRALHAQRSFMVERPAAPNAPGAAQSLASASDAVVEELVAWAVQSLKK